MSAAASEAPWPAPRTAWLSVGVLLLAYMLAYVDRAILTILVEPIQRDLGINDSQLALLHGLAFVIFYVGLGIPLGMLADRRSRKRLIAWSVLAWSAMTVACGFARSFGGLFAARVGVGIGEAGLSPASYSMIGDLFPPERRSAALGTYMVGIYAGGGMALLVGGLIVQAVGHNPVVVLPLLGEMRSWQVVFIVVGLPGVLVALLVAALPEPARRSTVGPAAGGSPPIGLAAQLRKHRGAYALHFVGFGLLGIPFNVSLLWARPFLSRQFGVAPADAAYIVGSLMLVCCSAGVLSGSLLADRMLGRGQLDATARVALIAALGAGAALAFYPFMPSMVATSAVLGVVLFFGAFAYGAGPAALQLFTPNHHRAAVSALYLLFANVVGLTLAPALSGALTDYVFADKASIGLSSSIVGCSGAALAAVCFALLRLRLRSAIGLEQGNKKPQSNQRAGAFDETEGASGTPRKPVTCGRSSPARTPSS